MGEQEEEELQIAIRDIFDSVVVRLLLIYLTSLTHRRPRGDTPPLCLYYRIHTMACLWGAGRAGGGAGGGGGTADYYS